MNDGGPAFPLKGVCYEAGVKTELTTGGMSLRDWFAGQALVAVPRMFEEKSVIYAQGFAFAAYAIADAMLKAREQSNA